MEKMEVTGARRWTAKRRLNMVLQTLIKRCLKAL